MPTNVEIKARARHPERLRQLAEAAADGPPVLIEQVDTFFEVPRGRLKLREFADGSGELIHYERPDAEGPKNSTYALFPTPDPRALAGLLAGALPARGVVRKRRLLLLNGRTRIHLDEVDGLGHFLELEVVLADGEDPAVGEAEACDLMERLEITAQDLVTGAYIDLLEKD